MPCLIDRFVLKAVLSVHSSSNGVLTTGIVVGLRCCRADVLVLTLLGDYWRDSGFETGILVGRLIMLQIVLME